MIKKEEKKILEEDLEEISCGYIAPISEIGGLNPGYWSKLKNIIQEAINELNEDLEKDKKKLIFRMVSDNESSDIIQESIVKSLYHDKVVICNISYRNPNVLFELGMRIGFNKSIIIIFDNMEKCPFDVSGIRYITYDKHLDYYNIIDFKNNLKSKINESLKNKDEGNPYLRVLKDEVLFEVRPQKKEVSATDKMLLDKLEKIENNLFYMRNKNLVNALNNELGIYDLNFYKSLNNISELRKLLDSEAPDEGTFIKKALLILKDRSNLITLFPQPLLQSKLKGYYNYYYKYIKD